MRSLRLLGLVVLLSTVPTGCTVMRPMPNATPAGMLTLRPDADVIEVTWRDGRSMRLSDPRIDGDSIIGYTDDGQVVRIPSDEGVPAYEAVDGFRTLALVTAPIWGTALIVALWGVGYGLSGG